MKKMPGSAPEIEFVLVRFFAGVSWDGITYVEKKFSGSHYQVRDVETELQDFILKYCRCSHCKTELQAMGRCKCGQYIEPDPIHAEFPSELESKFEKLWSKQRDKEVCKKKTLLRIQRKKQSGSYTKSQIETLYIAQDGCCYFCATSLISEDGKNNYHIDHYVPLSFGGRNEISNLVLACPPCNLVKSDYNADCFLQKLNATLDEVSLKKAKKIRSKVFNYKNLIAKL